MRKRFFTPNGKFLIADLVNTKSYFTIRDEACTSHDEDGRLVRLPLKDLGFAVGTACLAGSYEEAPQDLGHFLSTPGFIASRPFDTGRKASYVGAGKTSGKDIYISEAFSITGEPAWFLEFEGEHPICFIKLFDDVFQVIKKKLGRMPAVIGITGISSFPEDSVDAGEEDMLFSVGIGIHEEALNAQDPCMIDLLISFRNKGPLNFMVHSFFMNKMNELPGQASFKEMSSCSPGNKNLDSRFYFGEELMIEKARLWIFLPELSGFSLTQED